MPPMGGVFFCLVNNTKRQNIIFLYCYIYVICDGVDILLGGFVSPLEKVKIYFLYTLLQL